MKKILLEYWPTVFLNWLLNFVRSSSKSLMFLFLSLVGSAARIRIFLDLLTLSLFSLDRILLRWSRSSWKWGRGFLIHWLGIIEQTDLLTRSYNIFSKIFFGRRLRPRRLVYLRKIAKASRPFLLCK